MVNQLREVMIAFLAASRLENTEVNPKEDGRGGGVAESQKLNLSAMAASVRCFSMRDQLATSLLDIINCFSDPRVPSGRLTTTAWSLIFGIQQSCSNGRGVKDGESGIKLRQPK
jgi:hypothetical protein